MENKDNIDLETALKLAAMLNSNNSSPAQNPQKQNLS